MREQLTKAASYLYAKPTTCLELLGNCAITNDVIDEHKALFYLIKGETLLNLGKATIAKDSFKKGLSLPNVSELTRARLNLWMGYIHIENDEITSSKKLIEESIEVFKTLGEQEHFANALAFKGMMLAKDSNFTEAFTVLMEGLELAVSLNLPIVESRVCAYVSMIHFWLKDLNKSEKWIERSYLISKKNNYARLSIANGINLASMKILNHKPKEAIRRLKETKEFIINSEQDKNSLLASTLNNIGYAYTHEKNRQPAKALEYYCKSLDISKKIGKKSSICYALVGISHVLLIKKEATIEPFSSCADREWIENELTKARDLIGDGDDNIMLNQTVLEAHTNFYKYLGDFEKAFYYLEKLTAHKEQYFEKEKIDSVKVLQIEYALQQKELEFQKLELKQKKELEEINKSLEKKIAERTKDLTSKNQELEEYAYIVAHDLKEPIRSIVSFSQLLERKIKGKLNTDELELLNFIKLSGKNMGNLVQALLLYTTVNINHENLPENNLNQILNKILTSIHYSIEQNNATINIGKLPKNVKCDKVKISQLFQNIISNAIKFKKENQGIEIHINCEEQKEHYLFSISDNGIGIEKDYHERIFKLFNRLNKNQNYEGTGIGLSISKKIVEQHGGEIWLESEFGKGTTFYFTLPRN